MTFNNPVVGGDALIRQAIRSPNFVPGTSGQGTGWAINADGSAEFNTLSTNGDAVGTTAVYDDITANNTFTYQGQELSDLLLPFAQGVTGFGTFTQPAGTITTTAQTLGGITWTATLPNRQYRVTVTDITYTTSTAAFGNGGLLSMVDENAATIGNFQELGGNTGDSLGHSFFTYFQFPVGDHTMNINLVAVGGVTLTVKAHTATVVVEDMGPVVPNTGFVGSIGSQATTHSFSQNAIRSASYQGNGNQSDGSGSSVGDRMYFGQDPGFAPNGNWRSYAWFNSGTNFSSMAGFASCSKFDMHILVPWWFAIAGGTLQIGHHNDNSGAVPGTEPGSHAYQEVTSAFTARGQLKSISLLGNATLMNAVKAGTFKGIILGPGPTTSNNYYGYADGVAHGYPWISATYIK